MSKTHIFRIGKLLGTDKDLSLDLATLIDTRMLVQANSGGGKSYLLRLIAERTAGKVQMIILDPEGEFATLRERVDIALVGQGGEIATDLRSAALLARKLVELRVSAVIDLYDLELSKRRNYVRLFLESLMNIPRAQWHPLLVAVDESHLFCPERSAGEAESTQAIINLVSQGRKRGFCSVLLTQRLSKLHKDAAAELNNVAIGRTWLDVDQQRAGDLLGMGKEARQNLRSLEPGEFFAFGPAFKFDGVARFRADQVLTSHPKAGERHLMEVPQASDAIKQIVGQIGDLPKQAQEEAATLESAQREIAEMRRQLRARPVQVEQKVETKIERVEVPILKAEEIEQLAAAARSVRDFDAQAVKSLQEIHAKMSDLWIKLIGAERALSQSLDAATHVRQAPVRAAMSLPPPRLAPRVRSSIEGDARETDSALTAPQQRILDALARFEALGLDRVAKNNAAVFADQSPTSSGFSNNLGRLRALGLVDYRGAGQVALTDEGRAAAKPPEPIRSIDELHAAWYAKLSGPKARILRVLIEHYPTELTKEAVAQLAQQSPTSSGYSNNLGALRSLGVIDYPHVGYVVATKLLFPDI